MAIKVDNAQVVKEAIGVYVRDHIKPQITLLLNDAATETTAYVDRMFQPLEKKGGNVDFPIWDGDLRDSTGVGVYIDGKLTRYTVPPFAKYGSQWLDSALDSASAEYPSGAYISLFSAVPYAETINAEGSPADRGIGFFDDIKDFMESWIRSRMKLYLS